MDSSDPGQHILDELFVSRDVDEANLIGTQLHVSETDVNTDSPTLLLLKPISVNAGQCFQQSRFSMVDVAGCSDNHALILACPPGLANVGVFSS